MLRITNHRQEQISHPYYSQNFANYCGSNSVLLRVHRHKRGTCPKLSDKCTGPFTVTAQISTVNYIIEEPTCKKLQTVHENRMKLFPFKQMKISEEEYDDLFGTSDSEDSEEEFHGFKNTMADINARFRKGSNFKLFRLLPFVLLMWFGFLTTAVAAGPNLGLLYDCDAAVLKGIFAATLEKTCLESFKAEKLTQYKADVRKYELIRTKLFPYHCDAQHIVKECDENFLGMPSKKLTRVFIPTTRIQCKNAFRNKFTRYGRLVRIREGEWVTMNTKKYHCRWFRDDKEVYIKFRMRCIEAMIEGNADTIQQHITTSKCRWKSLACQPKKQRYGWIVWNRVPHYTRIFHSLGKFKVHQTGNFILVSELGIGGSIISRDYNLILLDNTCVLKTVNNSYSNGNTSFSIFAENYAKITRSNVQRELLEGRISREFMRESQLITTLAAILCRISMQVYISYSS